MGEAPATKVDLSRVGFVIQNDWYWRITEGAMTLDAEAMVRDFLVPLARDARSRCELTAVAGGSRCITVRVGAHSCEIGLRDAPDRVALASVIFGVNRAFAAANLGCAFALTVPSRFELRGVVLAIPELCALAGDPRVLMPTAASSRPGAG